MPVDVTATWANAPDSASEPLYAAADLRAADEAIFAGGTGGARGGVVPHQDNTLQVTVDGADLVTVQPGPVVLPGDASAWQGPYRAALTGAHSEQLTARHATYSRIDLVVFRMLDVDVVGTHTARTARVEVIAGTPSSSPVVPAQPSMSVELGRITVPADGGGAAAVDASFRLYAAAVGGELLAASFNRLPAGAPSWQRARVMDTGRGFIRKSGMWTPDRLSGTLTVEVVNEVFATGEVTFAHPFDVGPKVMAIVTSHTYYMANVSGSPTTTGCTIVVRNVNANALTQSVTVDWVAFRV